MKAKKKKIKFEQKATLKKFTFAFKLEKTSIPLTQSFKLSLNGTYESEIYFKN